MSAGVPRRTSLSYRSLRGGGWNNEAENLRAANRNRNHADERNDNIGFRVAAAPANTLNETRHRAGGLRASARVPNLHGPLVPVAPRANVRAGRFFRPSSPTA